MPSTKSQSLPNRLQRIGSVLPDKKTLRLLAAMGALITPAAIFAGNEIDRANDARFAKSAPSYQPANYPPTESQYQTAILPTYTVGNGDSRTGVVLEYEEANHIDVEDHPPSTLSSDLIVKGPDIPINGVPSSPNPHVIGLMPGEQITPDGKLVDLAVASTSQFNADQAKAAQRTQHSSAS